MGKALKEKRSSQQTEKPGSRQAGKLESWKAHLFIIAVLAFLAYSNTFHSPFQWDELGHIVENPVVKDLSYFTHISRAKGLRVYDGLKSRYIGYLTFALNYKLHGFNVLGYHVMNFCIHVINAVVVYFFVLLTFRTPYFLPPHPPLSKGRTRGGEAVSRQSLTDSIEPHSLLFTIHHSRLIALAVALVFVSHPIQTEAVTYVFQRFASLVTMFYLLSLVLYINGRLATLNSQQSAENSRFTIIWYLLSLLSAVLAMKTKENAFTLPVIITLYEFLFFSGPAKTRLLRLAPFLLTMLIVPLTIMATGGTPGQIISQAKDPSSVGFITLTPADYLFTQFRVFFTYIRLLFLPVNQTLLYDYPIYQSFFVLPALLSFVSLGALFGTGVYLVYKTQRAMGSPPHPPLANGGKEDGSLVTMHYLRLIAFGILWFFITQSVESSIIPIPMLIDEYRVYLPSVGFFLVVVAATMLLVSRIAMHRAKRIGQSEKDNGSSVGNPMFYALCALLILVFMLAAATYARNNVWKDKVSLWTDIVRKSPRMGPAYDNLGLVLEEAGRAEEAIEQYRKAVQLSPGYPTPHINLGYTLEAMGRLDEAIEEYQTVLRLDPRNWQARLNLGSAYGKKGLSDKAIEELQEALKIAPHSVAVFNNLANAYRQKGDIEKEIESYQKVLQFAPDYAEARYNLGRVYVQLKRLDEAIAELEAVVRLAPQNSMYQNTLGVLYGQKGLHDAAIRQFEEAIRLSPDVPAFRKNLEKAKGMKSKK